MINNLFKTLTSKIQEFKSSRGSNCLEGTSSATTENTTISKPELIKQTEPVITTDKPPVLVKIHDPEVREIFIDELKLIQKKDFVKSFEMDSMLYKGLKFGMFNLKKNIVGLRTYQTVDLVFCDEMSKIYRISGAYYSERLDGPIWYYRNKLSKKVRKFKFNYVYKPDEIDIHIFAIRTGYLKNQVDAIGVVIYENHQNVDSIRISSSLRFWYFRQNEFGFQIIADHTSVLYSYPKDNPEEPNTTTNPLKTRENKTRFTTIGNNQNFDIYKNFFDGEKFTFFFALNGLKPSGVIEEYSKKYQRYRLINEFSNDPSINVVINVPKDDLLGVFFLSYLKVKRRVNPIEIYQTDFEEILSGSNCNNEIILDELCRKYNCNQNELRDLMINKYGIVNILVRNDLFKPNQIVPEYHSVVYEIFFGYFTKKFKYKSKDDFYASDVYKSFRNNFKKNYADIGRNIYMKSFKKEFLLYKLVSFYYNDTVYQYRPKWLKRMSIDIYVPSLLLAIEFQGQQHYESIDYYDKDSNSFSERVTRDTSKAELCQLNGITLVHWPYVKEINIFELNKILNDFNHKLIEFETSDVSLSVQYTDYY